MTALVSDLLYVGSEPVFENRHGEINDELKFSYILTYV